jgi:50S ribosomal subunit-associated GTPase HflX
MFMAIQWFPGHMNSARKKAAETMASIDVVIELLDARMPEASTNPLVRELRLQRQRPCLKVLNKADLADPVVTAGVDRSLQPAGWRARGRAVVPQAWRRDAPADRCARRWRRIATTTSSRCGC